MPLATLRGVERQEFDAGVLDAEGVGGTDPRSQGGAVADGVVAQEVVRDEGDVPARVVIVLCEIVLIADPATQRVGLPQPVRLVEQCAEFGAGAGDPDPDRETGSTERSAGGRERGVGPREYGDLAVADETRVGACDRGGDGGRLAVFVVVGSDPDRWTVTAGRLDVATDVGAPQDEASGVDDLRGAAVVDGKADDLDAGKPFGDVEKQGRVGAGEAVDRLRRIADQENVVSATPDHLDHPVLERVEILRFIDEEMAEAPPDRIGPPGVVREPVDRHRQQVVEVDDAATALLGGEGVQDLRDVVRVVQRTRVASPDHLDVLVGGQPASRCERHVVDEGLEIGARAFPGHHRERADEARPVGDHRSLRLIAVDPTLAEELVGDRVERAGGDLVRESEVDQPAAQFSGGFPREGERQGVSGIGVPNGDSMRNAPCQDSRLARPGTGDDRHERRLGGDGGALVGVEIGHEGCRVHAVKVLFHVMPYPRKLLNDTETVALDMNPHWWFFGKAAAALVVFVILGIVAWIGDSGVWTALTWVAIVGIVASAGFLVDRYARWSTTYFVVTSDRVIYRSGVVRKHGIEIPLERVNNVSSTQSAFERVLGTGNLLIESGGESGQQRFTDIKNPSRVQNLIHAQRESNNTRMYGGASDSGTDTASQLEKLEGMLERGTLTQEEFDNEKRRLLGG